MYTEPVNGVTLNSNNATALGTLATVSLGYGGVFNATVSQTVSGLSSTSGFGTVNLNSNTLTVGSTDNASSSFSGTITGAGSLIKAGTGTLTLVGPSSYSGGTVIQSGVVIIDSATALGPGNVSIANSSSQLEVNEISGTIANNFTLGNTSAAGPFGAGALLFHNDGQTATLSGTVTLAASSQIRGFSSGGTTNFANPIGGTGNLTFNAGGAVPLHTQYFVLEGGASTYNGNTLIQSDGTANAIVQLNGGSLPSTNLTLQESSTTGGNDAVFDLNGNNQTLAGLFNIHGAGGLGSFVTNSSATQAVLTVQGGNFGGIIGANTTGGITGQSAGGNNIALVVSGGTFVANGANTYTGPTTVTAGGTLRLGAGVQTIGTGSYTTSPGNYSFTPASGNLLAGLTPTAITNNSAGMAGNNAVATGGVGKLTDGAISNTFTETTDLPQIYTIGSGASLTYTLGSAPVGYSLSKINIYSEWNDNGRSQITHKRYQLLDRGEDPTIFTAITNSAVNYTNNFAENMASLTTASGFLATGVYAVRFDFGTQQENNTWVGYSELEVTGVPTIGVNPLPITTALTVAATSTFDLSGANQQIVSLSDSSGSGGTVINSYGGTTSVLTLTPSGSTRFSGVIGGGSGAISLVINGTGTQELAGNNTYTGGTVVNNGTLRVTNTTGSGTGGGAVTVGDGTAGHTAILTGTGTINGLVTINGPEQLRQLRRPSPARAARR